MFHCFESNLVFCVEDWNDLFTRSKIKSCVYTVNKYGNMTNIDEDLSILAYPISSKNVHIPLIQNKNAVHSIYYRGNNRLGGIKLENDSINMLHVFYDRYTQYTSKERMLYFLQLGIQRILSNKTITAGIGKRYMCNYLHGIGYNTILNLPILNNSRDYPYSMNIGGEYWYRNLTFALNGYYNLNQILCLNQSSCSNHLGYPIIGYQIYIQSILPYISECKSHIKLEKFFYSKKNNNKSYNNVNNCEHVLSVGIGYNPIPILDFNIDNIFIKKKYVNTVFKIALNYQFNVPITQQIQKKYYNDDSLNVNNLSATIKPFLPEKIPITINNDIHNVSRTIYKVIGHSNEIKYIKINHNSDTSLKWDTVEFEQNEGKIVHCRDNLYKIHLPRYHIHGNNQICISCTEQDSNNTIHNQYKILIVIEKFQNSPNTLEVCNNSVIEINNAQIPNNSEEITDLFENNQSNQNTTSTLNNFDTHQDSVLLLDSDILNAAAVDTISENSCFTYDNNTNITSVVPVPPPIPNVLLFLQQSKSTTSLCNLNKPVVSSEKDDVNQKINESSSSSNPLESVLLSRDSTCFTENADDNVKDLFCQLLVQRQTKFSLIGTKEYIEKLEKSIVERKQIRHDNYDGIGKIFNKLHVLLSDSSSTDDEWHTDDSSDSFSESSNKN